MKKSDKIRILQEDLKTERDKVSYLENKLRGIQIDLCRGQVGSAALALLKLENMDSHVNRATVKEEFERLEREAKSLSEKAKKERDSRKKQKELIAS